MKRWVCGAIVLYLTENSLLYDTQHELIAKRAPICFPLKEIYRLFLIRKRSWLYCFGPLEMLQCGEFLFALRENGSHFHFTCLVELGNSLPKSSTHESSSRI